jgi:predicted small metal-binding protein
VSAYEFVCEHLVPGCTTKVRAETKEEAARRAARHLEEHHGKEMLAGSDFNVQMWQAIVRLHG